MIQFLEDLKGEGKKPLNAAERDELEKLRDEQNRLTIKASKLKKKSKKPDHSDSSDKEHKSEEDSDDSGKEESKKKHQPASDNSSDEVSKVLTIYVCMV